MSLYSEAHLLQEAMLEVVFRLRAKEDSFHWLNFFQISKLDLGESSLGSEQYKDELWKSHCFEFFFTVDPRGESYFEVNFSPQGLWAFYSFEKYRCRRDSAVRPNSLKTRMISVDPGSFDVYLQLDVASILMEKKEIYVAPTAILSFPNGNEFWALEHASEKPDFHNFKSKMIQLSKSNEGG